MTPIVLSPAARRAFERMAGDCQRVLGGRFVALIAHAPGAAAVFADRIAAADLDALAVLAEQWHREGLDTPLLMTPDEFDRSLDAFPLEYQAMIDGHVLIAGRDPFTRRTIDAADLRRACEVQAKSHLIHLRQGWLEAGGHDDELDELVERSAVPLRALLTSLARLTGHDAASDTALAEFAEAQAGMRAEIVSRVLTSHSGAGGGHRRPADLLPDYLGAAEQLWRFVDTWRAR